MLSKSITKQDSQLLIDSKDLEKSIVPSTSRNIETKQKSFTKQPNFDKKISLRNRSQVELILEKPSTERAKAEGQGRKSVNYGDEADMALNIMQAKDARNSQYGNSVFKDSSVAYLS